MVRKYQNSGFTLIELLVLIAIIAIIASLLVPALSNAKVKAKYINEVHSAKQVMLAYQMYADDNQGSVLPGYRYGLPAVDRNGDPISHPINARYPWRIAPYCGSKFELLYSSKNRSLLRSFNELDEASYVYLASVFPSLGVNSVFVGGDDLVLPPTDKAFEKFGNFCVLKASNVRNPSRLMTFSSARTTREDGREEVEGFYKISPPSLTKRMWIETNERTALPNQLGHVHFRYNGRAVSALFDGHVEGYTFKKLNDMRMWSDRATIRTWTLNKNK